MILKGIPETPNGLPLLNDDQIDRLAEDCAREFFPEMFERPQPIDPAEFIECCLGYDLDYLYLSSCQLYLGMTCFKDIRIPVFSMEDFRAEYVNVNAGTVVIDRALYEDTLYTGHEGRLRFTEAHEAGHCILHSNFFLRAKKDRPAFKTGESSITENDLAEHQADMFASCFLIPKASVRKLMDMTGAWTWTDREKLILVKDTYNVSWPTAFYRLRQLDWLETESTIFNWEEFSDY